VAPSDSWLKALGQKEHPFSPRIIVAPVVRPNNRFSRSNLLPTQLYMQVAVLFSSSVTCTCFSKESILNSRTSSYSFQLQRRPAFTRPPSLARCRRRPCSSRTHGRLGLVFGVGSAWLESSTGESIIVYFCSSRSNMLSLG
jgi:hypothetical protein